MQNGLWQSILPHVYVFSKMALDIRSEFESTSAFYSKIPCDLRFESSSTKEKESIHVIETLLGYD